MGKSTEKQKNQKITDANFDGKTKKAENRGWEKQWENRNQQKKKGWDNDGIVIDGKKRMERFRKLGNRWNFGTLCVFASCKYEDHSHVDKNKRRWLSK